MTAATLRRISDAVNHGCTGGNGEHFDTAEPGLEDVDMDFQYLSGAPIAKPDDPDNTLVLDVGDLICNSVGLHDQLKISVKEVVQFIVLKYDADTDKDWTIPEPAVFRDLLGHVAVSYTHLTLPTTPYV